ncbi:MAG: YfhO family protein [Candidatus Omnitrophota bacterium]
MKRFLKSVWPVGVIAVFNVIYFYKIIFLKKIYLIGDLYYYYFARVLVSNDLKNLIFPLWTNYLNCGFPLMANPEVGIFDPLNLLLLYLFNPHTAINILICAYFFMAGLFTFLFCRSLDLDRVSSLFSAIVFMFGGFFAGRLAHITMIFSATFLPLIFLFINLYFKNRQIRYIFLIGMSMGLSFLPGHPQIAIYGIFFSAIYFAFKAFRDISSSRNYNKIIIYVLLLVLILTIASGIAAVQILPTAELTQASMRSSRVEFKHAKAISFPFRNFITYIFPYFFGKDSTITETNPYWGKGSLWELFVYMGIFPLCFLFASFSRIRNDRRAKVFFWLFILSLLLALGKNLPIFFIAYHIILPFQYFMFPCRFVFVSSFTSAILAGLGLSFVLKDEILLKKLLRALTIFSLSLLLIVILFNCILYLGNSASKFVRGFDLKNIHNQLIIIFFAIIVFLLFLKKNKKIETKAFNSIIIIVTFIDLFILNCSHNVPTDIKAVTTASESVRFLKQDKDIFRVYNIGPDFPYGIQRHQEVRKIPFFVPWKIESANMAGPIYFSSYSFLYSLQERGGHLLIDQYLEKLGLLNVKYITSSVSLQSDELELLFDDGTIKIYKNPRLEPRVFFVAGQEIKEDISQSVFRKASSSSSIETVERSSNKVIINVDASVDGFLVLRETAYPGWKAFVDKKQEKILFLNIATRAVFLKKGKHSIKFIYSPQSLRTGLLISLSFLFISLIFIFTPAGVFKRKN